jgi:hypothetical protein
VTYPSPEDIALANEATFIALCVALGDVCPAAEHMFKADVLGSLCLIDDRHQRHRFRKRYRKAIAKALASGELPKTRLREAVLHSVHG